MDNKISEENKISGDKSNVIKSKKIRCSLCRKKCTLINFECGCGGIFCVEHKCGHSHNCKIIKTKKDNAKKIIEENNPKTESHKMDYI